MCTVLQQHLARISNGYEDNNGEAEHPRNPSPGPLRLTPQPTYSYLGAAQDTSFTMKRPIGKRYLMFPHCHYLITSFQIHMTERNQRPASTSTFLLLIQMERGHLQECLGTPILPDSGEDPEVIHGQVIQTFAVNVK